MNRRTVLKALAGVFPLSLLKRDREVGTQPRNALADLRKPDRVAEMARDSGMIEERGWWDGGREENPFWQAEQRWLAERGGPTRIYGGRALTPREQRVLDGWNDERYGVIVVPTKEKT